ncbi:hypothetical protein BGW80DRAFT_1568899 [Lactifluus volemus]|nr:hypothetical protein BGW80DRAFT_1568899 [Lactifluus volemus]
MSRRTMICFLMTQGSRDREEYCTLAQSDTESDTEPIWGPPCRAYISDDESQGDAFSDNGSDPKEEWSDNDPFDPVTKANTERNALVPTEVSEPDPLEIADLPGEGVNVVVPPEPYFPTTLNHSNPKPTPPQVHSP